jgi:hypothetical protein
MKCLPFTALEFNDKKRNILTFSKSLIYHLIEKDVLPNSAQILLKRLWAK